MVPIALIRPPIFLSVLAMLVITAWLWLPIVFVAYAIGRKHFGKALVLTFIAVEIAAIAAFLKATDAF